MEDTKEKNLSQEIKFLRYMIDSKKAHFLKLGKKINTLTVLHQDYILPDIEIVDLMSLSLDVIEAIEREINYLKAMHQGG